MSLSADIVFGCPPDMTFWVEIWDASYSCLARGQWRF